MWEKAIMGWTPTAAVLLTVVAAPAAAGGGGEATVVALRRELAVVRARLERLVVERELRGARRRAAPATALAAGSKPRSWKLPGTSTSIRIGGFTQLDLIYDFNHFAGDSLSSNGASRTSFPSAGTAAAGRTGNFRLHARRTRFFIRTWTPTDWGAMETRIEVDFSGAGGNQLFSNSNGLRMRHAYGRLGPILAGQTNSAFRFRRLAPRVVESRGPAGAGAPRQAQLRYIHALGRATDLTVSIENPENGRAVASSTFAPPVVISAGGAPDRIPDFVISFGGAWSTGRARLAGFIGERNVDNGGGASGAVAVWGVQAGFKIRLGSERTTLGATTFFGYGIGRYFRGTPADVAITGSNGADMSVNGVRNFGGVIWLRNQWTKRIQTNFVFGRTDADVERLILKALIPARTLDIHWTVHANLFYEPVDNVTFGLEYVFAKSQFHNARAGTVSRFQLMLRYTF